MPASSERSRWWVPYAVLGPVLLLAVVLAIALLFADGLESHDDGQQLAAGTPWAGQSITGFGDGSPEDFDEFPIAWAGPDALGYRLQSIQHSGESVAFAYGVCTRGTDACAPPLTVTNRSICQAPDGVRADADGAEHAHLDEGGSILFILTGGTAIEIAGNLQPSVLRSIPSELVPYGVSRSVLGAIFEEFPPPDLASCD